MAEQDVHLLNARCRVRRDDQQMLGIARQIAAAFAGESRSGDAHAPGHPQCGEDVCAFARRSDRQRDVTRTAKRLDLAGENFLKAQIICCRGQRRAVGCQRDRRDGLAIFGVTDREFGREVLRVGRAAAIAEQHDLAAGADAVDAGRHQRDELRFERRNGLLARRVVFGKFALEIGGNRHAPAIKKGAPQVNISRPAP